MNKISMKLAAHFFIVVFVMEFLFMFYLHQSIIDTRIEEAYSQLLSTGSNHRDVLEENYSDATLHHIVLMERGADREVVIIDNKGHIITSSSVEKEFEIMYKPLFSELQGEKDVLVVTDWKESPYIISVHPYKAERSGYVVMFQSTAPIRHIVHHLNWHFSIAGITSVILLIVVYVVLSKILTKPLIRMKEATEQLSKGDFSVSLPHFSKDELGELANAIEKLAYDLERLQKERNEFLASVAHELSTPLTYLIGYSNVAMRKQLDEKERERYLKIIAEESNHMKELIKNLLDLARMDENFFTVKKEPFLVKAFFERICQRMESSFNMKEMTLKFICEQDFELCADPLRLEQIIFNLLDNALKYSEAQTEVILEVMAVGEKAKIIVKDSGIGIEQEEIKLIFEKLYRVEKSRSRAFGGTGIGLAIVKELVEAHGGTIDVKSKVGKGSTFTIVI